MSERDNFSSLTGALVLLLLLVSLADQLEITVGQVVIQGMIVLVLALGVWSISSRSRWRLTRIGFIVALLGLSGAGAFLDSLRSGRP